MKKLKLLASGKSKKHHHYTMQKTQEVFLVSRALLEWLGFDKFKWASFGRPIDKKWGEPIFNKEDNIKSYVDRRYAYEKDGTYVELIFGKDKFFMIIHTEKDMQQQLSKFMSKFFTEC